MQTLTTADVAAAQLADWRKLAQALHARFRIENFTEGAAFVQAVAQAADAADHHPDLTMTSGVVDVAVCTHHAGRWVTEKDVDLARTISRIAREHGLRSEPAAVTQLELALDTASLERVAPFWAVLLTGSDTGVVQDTIFDPTNRVPSLWFQGTEEHETPRQRWHVDLWLAPEAAAERIAAAVAAGGTVVSAAEAPSFTVLADPDGNQVCVCTSLDRE